MTHAEALARRIDMAREVAAGYPLGTVARKYSVSVDTVRAACREADHDGYQASKPVPVNATTLAILAALEHGEDHITIARRFHKSRKTIAQMYDNAEAAGLAVRMPCADFQGFRAPEPAEKPLERLCGPLGAK